MVPTLGKQRSGSVSAVGLPLPRRSWLPAERRLAQSSRPAKRKLPIRDPDAAGLGAAPEEVPLHVLVIEDNVDAAHTLQDLLELAGYQVTVAFTGPAGVAAALSLCPDVVLSDIGLPGMDGFEVAAVLRREAKTARLKLIATTAYGRREDQERGLAAGFDVYLTKPVDVPLLLKALGR